MSSRAASYRSRTTCLKWSSTSKRFGSKTYILFVYINCRNPIALEYLWRRYAEAILTRRSMRFSTEWQRPAWPSLLRATAAAMASTTLGNSMRMPSTMRPLCSDTLRSINSRRSALTRASVPASPRPMRRQRCPPRGSLLSRRSTRSPLKVPSQLQPAPIEHDAVVSEEFALSTDPNQPLVVKACCELSRMAAYRSARSGVAVNRRVGNGASLPICHVVSHWPQSAVSGHSGPSGEGGIANLRRPCC